MKLKKGYSRAVWLVGNYAFKFPRLSSGRQFACGLLSNIREAENWAGAADDRSHLAPVLWAAASGALLIMRRAKPMSPSIQKQQLEDRLKQAVGYDLKRSSFGMIDGNIVAVDYHRNIST